MTNQDKNDMQVGRDWRADSSLEKWFLISAETIQRQAARIAALEEAVRLYEEAKGPMIPTGLSMCYCAFCETMRAARAAAEKVKV